MTEDPPELRAHKAAVGLCERRIQRAADKLAIARREAEEARDALVNARARLEAWVKAHPDPQIEML